MPWYENYAGQRLWYEEKGSGIPLLLLHGWCMTSSVWQFQLDALATDYRIIAPDLRGFGKSCMIKDGCNFDAYVSDIAALVERLELSQLILAGWSMGAEIAVMALKTLNAAVSGLVLISGTPSFSQRDGFPYGLESQESEGMALKVRRNINRAFTGFINNMFTPGELDKSEVTEKVNSILSSLPIPDASVALKSLKSLAETDIRTFFHEIDIPVLILNGDRDIICLPGASQWMADILSTRSTHIVFTGTGHAPFLTMPDKFNSCVKDFIRKLTPRSSGEQYR